MSMKRKFDTLGNSKSPSELNELWADLFSKKSRTEPKDAKPSKEYIKSQVVKLNSPVKTIDNMISRLCSAEIFIHKYLGNIPNLHSPDDIAYYFNTYGRIEDVNMLKNLNYYTFDEEDLIIMDIDDPIYKIILKYSKILTRDKSKVYMILKTLNEDQLKFICATLENFELYISNPRYGRVLLLDAPAGTGKSFTIIALMLILNHNILITFSVYRHDLLNLSSIANFHKSRNFKTVASLVQSITGVHFKNKTTLHDLHGQDKVFVLYKLLAFAIHGSVKDDMLIIDEYTILEPTICLLLVLIARLQNKFVLFLGDKLQQTSILKSALHDKWNISLINPDYQFEFTKQQRVVDLEYNSILQALRNDIYDIEKLVPNMDLYKIYLTFRDNFHMEEKYDSNTIYISSWHNDLASKLRRFMMANKFELLPYIAYFENKFYASTMEDVDWKFCMMLPLKVGFYYLYTRVLTINGVKKVYKYIVRLNEINDSSLIISNDEIGVVTLTEKCRMDNFYMLDGHLNDVKAHFKRTLNITPTQIYSWPLQPFFIKTLYSIQGLTFPKDINLEVSLDHITYNSLYVALTRIKERGNLGRIHSQLFYDFETSYHKNDGYYYHLSKRDNELMAKGDITYNDIKYDHRGRTLLSNDKEDEKDTGKIYLYEMLTSLKKIEYMKIQKIITNDDDNLLNSLILENMIAVKASSSPYKESYDNFEKYITNVLPIN